MVDDEKMRLKGIEELSKELEIDKEDLMGRLWNKIIEVGKKWEKGITHKMNPLDVEVIVRTVESIHPTQPHFPMQLGWDLTVAKYKLYDEIGMLMMGGYKGYPGETPQDVEKLENWSINLALDYIGCSKVANSLSELYKCVVERTANRSWGHEIENKKFKFSAKEVLQELIK